MHAAVVQGYILKGRRTTRKRRSWDRVHISHFLSLWPQLLAQSEHATAALLL